MVDLDLLKYLENFVSEKRKTRFEEVLSFRTRFLTVVTEDVFQLHNTSAVIRSCEVFGIQDLHLIEEQFGSRLDKNIALGAQQWVDVKRHNTTVSCLEELKKEGYQIIATTPAIPEAVVLDEFRLEKPSALVFGTEKEGVTQEVLDRADSFLKIPMVGFTQSLNISVSVAIILYRLASDLRRSDLPWELSGEEKLRIRMDWVKRSIKSIDKIMERYKQET